ncbi:MAG: hypothetical protein IJL03_08335 [Lachnospiraceae bacterium]|nr:hypothetical protein [Lachnospiraceae bacterium]
MKKKSVFTASAIVAGNGIGSGVMAIPYFVSKTGVLGGVIAFAAAYVTSVLLHLMIAQILLNTGETADILSSFNRYLFRGRFKNVLKISFFLIMVVVLETNLAAYISGAAEITAEFVPNIPGRVLGAAFYLIAAVVVLLGLRAICISEKVTVSVMGAILLAAVIFSIRNINPSFRIGIGLGSGAGIGRLAATFSMIMFSFSAIFAVPQVIECLDHDAEKVRKSVFGGLLMNLAISAVVTVCAVITSKEVTEVAIVGWAEAVGGVIRILGSAFILLAMFTSYWSIGLATTEMISSQTKKTFGLSFLLATVPALLLMFFLPGGFMEYMKIAGGAVAVIISLMVIPTYRICTKGKESTVMNRAEASKITIAVVFVMYLIMAVGSMISV